MRADNSLLLKRIYEFGSFRLNTVERVLESGGQPLSISPKALEVLIVLVENRGRIVEKEDLMRKVWPETFVEDNNLAFNISVLRKLFGESGASPHYIETVPRRGYRFIAKVVEVPEMGLPGIESIKRDLNGKPALLHALQDAPAPPSPLSTLARPRNLLAALFILALAGILSSQLYRTPKLTDRDTIVLADFTNKTGDPVFDGTLYQGLAIQLEQSPFLSLISEARIRQTLRLMGQSADARLTPELARDVCERTASAAVLEGSIVSLGSQYVLGLRARNCATGDILDDEQVKAGRKEDVLDGLSQIARNFRSRVGESLATLRRHDTPLAEATTSSLEALKAYDSALKVHFSSGARAALPLFRHVVEIDPEFAMAHSYLGRMYANLDESDLAEESTKRAWRLRDRVSDRERFSIATRYDALVTGNLEEMRQTCEAWLRAYPRDRQPHIGLSGYDKIKGQYEKAAAEARRATEVAPDFSVGYSDLAAGHVDLNRLGEADDTLRRAAGRGLQIDEFAMLQYDIAFLRGDQPGMERAAAQVRGRSGAENWISAKEAFVLAYSGRLQQARSHVAPRGGSGAAGATAGEGGAVGGRRSRARGLFRECG